MGDQRIPKCGLAGKTLDLISRSRVDSCEVRASGVRVALIKAIDDALNY